jgi:rubrerythrin
MAPRQFIFFLRWAAEFHKDLREFYERKSREVLSPEVETLLQYLSRHEGSLAEIIEAYEDDAPPEILDAWFKVAPELRAVKQPADLEFAPDATVDEVIDKALEMDESLISVYRMLIRQAVPERLREVLQNLVEDEEREEKRLLKSRR